MSNEKIIKKIQKCLALSKSSNEHEAAAALRQAKALMDKHNLTLSDMELSAIDVVHADGGYERPPRWKVIIYQAAAAAFGCSLFTRGGRPVFVGVAPSPQIALYAVDVLVRQMELNKAQYMAEMKASHKINRSQSIILGKGFAEGWAIGCINVVKKFASPVPADVAEKHEKKVEDFYKRLVSESKDRKSALDDEIGMHAARKGYQQGLEAKIHTGMGADAGPVMIGEQL